MSLGADGGADDVAEAPDRLLVHETHRGDLRQRLVAVGAGANARVVLRPDALEDGLHLLYFVGRGFGIGLRKDGSQSLVVGACGLRDGVDERQRLLARDDVRGLLAGAGLVAPDTQQVVVELEGQAQCPAEAAVGRDDGLVIGGLEFKLNILKASYVKFV